MSDILSRVPAPFYILISNTRTSNFFTYFPTFVIICLFYYNHLLDWNGTVVLIYIFMIANDVENCFLLLIGLPLTFDALYVSFVFVSPSTSSLIFLLIFDMAAPVSLFKFFGHSIFPSSPVLCSSHFFPKFPSFLLALSWHSKCVTAKIPILRRVLCLV